MLAFGIEIVISIEVNIPSQRKLEPKALECTTEHLDLLEKVREQAFLKIASYQDKTVNHFNSRVRPQKFRAGDLVLRRAEAADHAPGKLGPIWEGPFEVIRQIHGGAYNLRDISRRPLPRPCNVENLKIYYK